MIVPGAICWFRWLAFDSPRTHVAPSPGLFGSLLLSMSVLSPSVPSWGKGFSWSAWIEMFPWARWWSIPALMSCSVGYGRRGSPGSHPYCEFILFTLTKANVLYSQASKNVKARSCRRNICVMRAQFMRVFDDIFGVDFFIFCFLNYFQALLRLWQRRKETVRSFGELLLIARDAPVVKLNLGVTFCDLLMQLKLDIRDSERFR